MFFKLLHGHFSMRAWLASRCVCWLCGMNSVRLSIFWFAIGEIQRDTFSCARICILPVCVCVCGCFNWKVGNGDGEIWKSLSSNVASVRDDGVGGFRRRVRKHRARYCRRAECMMYQKYMHINADCVWRWYSGLGVHARCPWARGLCNAHSNNVICCLRECI